MEKKKLLEGEKSRVLDQCISCYACNAFCPHDCHPYELILFKRFNRYREKGLPVRAEYLMPSSESNFRTDLVPKMSGRERELINKWQETPPEGELVLYPGCNILALPHLLDASFMEGITIAGGWELCCGEMYFRMGLLDEVKRRAGKLTEYYRDKKIGTMLFSCTACLNMFANVLPHQFGARFKFETKYLGTYLLEQVEAGRIRLETKIDKTVTVHDSCHARILGADVMDDSRRLLEKGGARIVEMELNREEGLCCGAAAGGKRYNPFDILFASARALKEGRKAGTEEIALYCGGCQLAFSLCGLIIPSRPPVRHMLEYVKVACGEEGSSPARTRAAEMLFNILAKLFPTYLSSRRFWIADQSG